jgi:diadenosine tetraphosphate (Ap4A) HIT family hydrolase
MTEPDCIFCNIVWGQAPASIVYGDQHLLAFLDIQPITPGHILIVPREHAENLSVLDAETGGRLFQAGMRMATAIRRSGIPCEGINLHLADGRAAGQEVLHVHLHVIPRFSGDGFGLRFSALYYDLPDRPTLDRIAFDIRQALEE